MKKLVILRVLSQSLFSLLFIYILWSTTYPLKGIISPEAIFKFDPLIMIITSISERVIIGGLIFSLAMLALTLVLGRFFCGWVCPLGAAIDLAGAVRKEARSSDAFNRRLAMPKFFILGAIVAAALLAFQFAWIFDPLVIGARFVSLNMIPTGTFLLDRALMLLIRASGFNATLYDVYRSLKVSLLGVNVHYFSHAFAILAFFVALVCSALTLRRFWCRALCPLGAVYALTARRALLRRRTTVCVKCTICKSRCRMGAIHDGNSGYSPGECVLCMDCLYDCPPKSTKFTFAYPGRSRATCPAAAPDAAQKISRKNFLLLLSASVPFLYGFSVKERSRARILGGGIIRPPAALSEEKFLDRCIRCGNCMKVCITNGLQPALLQSGLAALWTPHMVNEIGYCEYQCTLCGNVCPTGAIPPISRERKMKTRLGLAQIDRSLCIPWAESKECLVCQEHCPVSDKAIKLIRDTVGGKTPAKPVIDASLCVGCGICQNKCPVRPARAIRVYPIVEDRS